MKKWKSPILCPICRPTCLILVSIGFLSCDWSPPFCFGAILVTLSRVLSGKRTYKKTKWLKSFDTLGWRRCQISALILLIKVVNNLLCRYFRWFCRPKWSPTARRLRGPKPPDTSSWQCPGYVQVHVTPEPGTGRCSRKRLKGCCKTSQRTFASLGCFLKGWDAL